MDVLKPLHAGRGVVLMDNGDSVRIDVDQNVSDHKVATGPSDENPGYLAGKILAGSNVSVTNLGSALEISAAAQEGDHKVSVDGTDTAGYLENKIMSGTNVSFSKAFGKLIVSADEQEGDHKVSVDGTDTADYLEDKIDAGSNVSISKSSGKLIISSTDTGMLNPMTTAGDIIVGGASGSPGRLAIGTTGQVLTVSSGTPTWQTIPTQDGDHKVLATNFDAGPAGYLDSKLSFSSPLIATGTDYLSVSIDYGSDGQILGTTGSTVGWVNAPKRIDWSIETALLNGTFNQTVDRTFYVEIFPECSFTSVDSVVAVLRNASSSDEWRAAVYDNQRNMIYYGTSTGTSANFRKISLTKLANFDFDANNVFFLALSQHVAGSSSSVIATATVTSPFYCWYEDHVLESGRAMPANTSLTAVSGKVPAIGLRGR